jgi:hypothetical protein
MNSVGGRLGRLGITRASDGRWQTFIQCEPPANVTQAEPIQSRRGAMFWLLSGILSHDFIRLLLV